MPLRVTPPADRTCKQPVRAYCANPQCWEMAERGRFEFEVEHGEVTCPKCGANEPPMIGLLVLVHLLLPDPRGPINGAGGIRYRIACDEHRAYLATTTNKEAATGAVEAANCGQCLKVASKLGVAVSGRQLAEADLA